MRSFDYVIVGSGAAGCVMAYRLSADPTVSVALIEAGPRDTHPFIHMPKGMGKVMQDPRHLWPFPCEPEVGTAMTAENWLRGRVLGGSTAINGMMYVRGQPADFDALAAATSEEWSWPHIAKAYSELESHELGGGVARGSNGPLKVTMPTDRDELSEAFIAAGVAMGWSSVRDVNAPDDIERIGYAPRTIYRGRRQSAATAFLRPASSRPNLTILTDTLVDTVLFDGNTAIGVSVLTAQGQATIHAQREVILCAGALASPLILQRSGVGSPELLAALGIPLVKANRAVGQNLSEHRGILMQWKLRREISQNREFSGPRLLKNTARYYLLKQGPLSTAAYEIGAWMKTHPDLERPDAQFLVAPFSYDLTKFRAVLEPFPGMHMVAYVLRPTSRGSLAINSRDPNATPTLRPNYHATADDLAKMIDLVRVARRYVQQEPLRSMIDSETSPGPAYATAAEIIEGYDRFGTCAYHAVGTCRMGRDADSVVDAELRVRGVDRLRVVDTSIMPSIPSGNTNGPTMAIAWRAADIIRRTTQETEGHRVADFAARLA